VIAPLGAIYLASQWAILTIIEPLDPAKVLALQTTFSADQFRAIEQGWQSAGVLGAYWRHFILDFPHPIWYGLLSAACLALALQFAGRSERYDFLIFVPIVAAACDLVENLFHVAFLLAPGLVNDPLVATSASFTHTKWFLMAASNVALLALLAVGLALRWTKRPSQA